MDELKAERLSVYHDRELEADEAARLGAGLDADPEARARLAALMRVDDAARAALDAELEAPAPAGLARGVSEGFAARRRRAHARRALRWAGAVAAAVALAVGAQHWMAQRAEEALAEREARLAELAQQAVQRALESAVSGVEVAMADARVDGTVSITPTRTYRSESRHWCREFEERVRVAGKEIVRSGVACRGQDGEWWRVETRLPGSEPPPVGTRVL